MSKVWEKENIEKLHNIEWAGGGEQEYVQEGLLNEEGLPPAV
jgi:hypothetical protein